MGRLNYKDSGVDIQEGDRVAMRARDVAASTPRQNTVIGGIGGFAGLVRPDFADMSDPVLVFSTDGVGTKLLMARQYGLMQGLGIDLVAMCANDILCTGGRGIAFLDYYATGGLDAKEAGILLDGIGEGCRQADTPLVGGETAELPGLYARGDFDLAGFMAGIVDRETMTGPANVREGDVLIGVQSTGPHSNGYSLIRRIVEARKFDLGHVYEDFDRPLGEVLLQPTAIYSIPVFDLVQKGGVHAMAHITGGGLAGNLVRVLPQGLRANIEKAAIPRSAIWNLLQGPDIDEAEMWRVFNMGVGLVLAVDAGRADELTQELRDLLKKQDFLCDLDIFTLGKIATGERAVEVV